MEKQRQDAEVEKLDEDADFLKELLAGSAGKEKRDKGTKRSRDDTDADAPSATVVKAAGYDDLVTLIAKQARVARATESAQEVEKRT